MATLHRFITTVVFLSAGVLFGCPSAGVDKPPPDPLRTDASVDASAPDAEPFADAEPAQDAEPADAEPVDAEPIDTGFLLRSGNLSPAAGSAGSPEHQLNGSFRASSGGTAVSGQHKLRGALGPLSR